MPSTVRQLKFFLRRILALFGVPFQLEGSNNLSEEPEPQKQEISASKAPTLSERKKIELIVLHSDPGPAEKTLKALREAAPASGPHYYVDTTGQITQLAPEEQPTLHSGVATWRGESRNIDRLSIGIAVEHPQGTTYGSTQVGNLRSLIDQLRVRYNLSETALVGWWMEEQIRDIQIGKLIPVHLNATADEQAGTILGGSGEDPEAIQRLWLLLCDRTYALRAEGFHKDWAIHLYAAQLGLGAPLCNGGRGPADAGGKQYGYQVFGRDTLCNEVPKWQALQRFSSLIDSNPLSNFENNIPRSGLARQILELGFKASLKGSPIAAFGGLDFHPDWSFHQLAVRQRLGSPLSGSFTISINGQTCNLQIFAADTVYCFPPAWANVQRLSETPAGSIREALWEQNYKQAGVPYGPSSPFHQRAAELKLGAPLSGVTQVDFEGAPYMVQVFALDTLFAASDNVIKRLSDLPKPSFVTSFKPAAVPPPPPPPPPSAAGKIASGMTSGWADYSRAPAKAQLLIDQALFMLGNDNTIYDKLDQKLQQICYGWEFRNNPGHFNHKDIVCADLATICLLVAGLPYQWQVTGGPYRQHNNHRLADYFRPTSSNPNLRELADHEAPMPGDLNIYGDAPLPGGSLGHVDLYIGPFSGTDQNGRQYPLSKGFNVVCASIDFMSGGNEMGTTILPYTLEYCRTKRYGYTWMKRMRHVQLEQEYKAAGISPSSQSVFT